MDAHHVVEALGIVVTCLLYYSYASEWLHGRLGPGTRPLVHGGAFGLAAVALMVARIHTHSGVYVDARSVPIALVGLLEGWRAGLAAGAVAALYRLWMGGPGAPAGVATSLAIGLLGGLVHAIPAERMGSPLRRAMVLAGLAYLATLLGFMVAGEYGRALVDDVWLPLLVLHLVGVGLMARPFRDVLARARRLQEHVELAELRAVRLTAQTTAHEINNPLTVLLGSLALLTRPGHGDADRTALAERAMRAGERIRDVVARMQRIVRVERSAAGEGVPATLDVARSSEGVGAREGRLAEGPPLA
jgi:signal transduction histidine kinase